MFLSHLADSFHPNVYPRCVLCVCESLRVDSSNPVVVVHVAQWNGVSVDSECGGGLEARAWHQTNLGGCAAATRSAKHPLACQFRAVCYAEVRGVVCVCANSVDVEGFESLVMSLLRDRPQQYKIRVREEVAKYPIGRVAFYCIVVSSLSLSHIVLDVYECGNCGELRLNWTSSSLGSRRTSTTIQRMQLRHRSFFFFFFFLFSGRHFDFSPSDHVCPCHRATYAGTVPFMAACSCHYQVV